MTAIDADATDRDASTRQHNLVDDAWLPVLDDEGVYRRVSLREAFADATHLRSLDAAAPIEAAALHRLLLAIAHAALDGPRSIEARETLWRDWACENKPPEPILTYLDKHRDRFWLDDPERPFMQDPAVEPTDAVSDRPATLLMPAPNGINERRLYEHRDPASPIPWHDAAVALVAMQSYAAGGRRSAHPNLDADRAASGKQGLLRTVLAAWLEGRSLAETLVVNLVTVTGDVGTPCWQRDPAPQERIPEGVADLYTFQSCGARLSITNGTATRARIAPGQRLPAQTTGDDNDIADTVAAADPMVRFAGGDDDKPLRMSAPASVWLDYPALAAAHVRDGGRHSTVAAAAELFEYLDPPPLRLRTVGLAGSQGRNDHWHTSHYPIDLSDLSDLRAFASRLTALSRTAEGAVSSALLKALLCSSGRSADAGLSATGPRSTRRLNDHYKPLAFSQLHAAAGQHFPAVLQQRIDGAHDDELLADWRRLHVNAGLDAFDHGRPPMPGGDGTLHLARIRDDLHARLQHLPL